MYCAVFISPVIGRNLHTVQYLHLIGRYLCIVQYSTLSTVTGKNLRIMINTYISLEIGRNLRIVQYLYLIGTLVLFLLVKIYDLYCIYVPRDW